jgi:polysaccharide biosynthesis protein PslH
MNILFVVPYTPTLIRTRPYNLLRGLARRGNTITLATLWENEQERATLAQLERDGIRVFSVRLTKLRAFWNMLRALPTSMPLQAVYCWQPELVKLLISNHQSLISNYDVVHVEHLRGARYGLQLNSSLPIVWDSVDCISYLFEQAARNSRSLFGRFTARFELARTRQYEAMLVNRFDRVLVTSPVDAAALIQLADEHDRDTETRKHGNMETERLFSLCPRSTVTVLPNGVDVDYFAPSDAPRDSDTIVFTGKMSYHANVTAALYLVNDIMPLIWKERPNVRVNIVGHKPPTQVLKLATRHSPFVTVFDSVPDIRPYLQCATVAVAPIQYGAGIQNKVLEAMACATPVVVTPQAIAAIRVVGGEQLLIGDGAEAFARQTLRLLGSAELQRQIGTTGRKFVERNHAWGRIVEHLEEIYQIQPMAPSLNEGSIG